MTYTFGPDYNPAPAALHALNPDIDIPTGYTGYNTDPWLAHLTVKLLNQGVPFDTAVAPITAEKPSTAHSGNEKFAALANRYGIPKSEMLYYIFYPALPMDGDTPEASTNLYYVLYLAVNYGPDLLNMAPTLMRVITDLADGIDRHLDIDTISKLLNMNAFLTREGIVLNVTDAFIASQRWTLEETLELLVHGIKLHEAVDFTRMGVYDTREIIEKHKVMPKSLIDALLRPDPKELNR